VIVVVTAGWADASHSGLQDEQVLRCKHCVVVAHHSQISVCCISVSALSFQRAHGDRRRCCCCIHAWCNSSNTCTNVCKLQSCIAPAEDEGLREG